ncbi:MAG TPA: N-acetyltransferase family protein, partial [Thermoflexales bacterium]|nr:N-acetyltransferase family protein [Thermoflexales bacterium]
YASTYRPRIGYRFTCEDSIYVHNAYRGQGVARVLLTRVMDECAQRGYRQMMAVIGDSANAASIGLHKSLGFEQVGLFRNIGYKFDRWLDGVYMQKSL